MKFVIVGRSSFTPELQQVMFDLITFGGQVKLEPDILKKNIANCEFYGLCMEDGEYIACAAIKHPQKSYIRKVFEQSGNVAKQPRFHFEIGYCVTLPAYRGKGICALLVKELMLYSPNTNFWATTNSPTMKNLFHREDFVMSGIYNNHELYLYECK